jgi:hypothetical protein
MRNKPSLRVALTFSVIIGVVMLFAFLLRQTRAEVEMKAVHDRSAAGDLLAFPVEVRPGYEAIALIDKENETLSLYQYDFSRVSHERLVLLAARSFRYDRMLEDYNTAQPRPDEIKQRVMQSLLNPPGNDGPVDPVLIEKKEN